MQLKKQVPRQQGQSGEHTDKQQSKQACKNSGTEHTSTISEADPEFSDRVLKNDGCLQVSWLLAASREGVQEGNVFSSVQNIEDLTNVLFQDDIYIAYLELEPSLQILACLVLK